MRPIGELNMTISKFFFLSLALLFTLSVACDGNKPSTPATGQNNGANAAPTNNQTNQPVTAPSANSSTGAEANATGPNIQITEIPSKGAGPDALETIAGTVSGVKVKDCKVVIFARTNTWYVQPYIDSPDTTINDDGTWHNDTHLGSQYAALLVKASYKPPTTTGKLPTGGLILATATANAK
jgi:hypothetical protein